MGPFRGQKRPEYLVQVWDGNQWLEHRVFGYRSHPAPPLDVFIARLQEEYPGREIRQITFEQRDRRLDLPTRSGDF